MIESLFASQTSGTLSIGTTLLGIGASLLLGLMISLIYMATHKKEGYTPSFPITLIMLPAIICIIILLIDDNIARAFSLAGAFSLIRFRSAASDPKDISYVFFALAVGLASGLGYIGYAALFAMILCGVMLLLQFLNFANPQTSNMLLKITVPENLNYQDLFDDVLIKYTDVWKLTRVKTSDFGTLFNLVYRIQPKAGMAQKDFLDELRCRNGNLDISLTMNELEDKIYY